MAYELKPWKQVDFVFKTAGTTDIVFDFSSKEAKERAQGLFSRAGVFFGLDHED